MALNPFKVYSPEAMSADQVVKLFVPVAEGLEISGPEHVFIHGPRGSGKSMMLRYMAPDCQILSTNKPLKELEYVALYATIKTTDLDVVEYERLQNQYAGTVLAEHSLVTFLGVKAFQSIQEYCLDAIKKAGGTEELQNFITDFVFPRLRSCGVEIDSYLEQVKSASTIDDAIRVLICTLDDAYGYASSYLKRSSFFYNEYLPYKGPLLTYREFLSPVLNALSILTFMPQGKPVYFLVDDADNLHPLQKKVLNTWVSFRTGKRIAFKISTQLSYNVFLTISNQRIEPAHDFREIHVSSIYTSPSSPARYPQWVEKVIEKRLSDHGISGGAREFFPEDAEQEAKIKKIKEEKIRLWETSGRGYRPHDDAYRYARPDYIKNLGGASKQTSTYRYAGFEQLVHISSGIVRFFLDNAAEMYSAQELRLQNSEDSSVSVNPTYIEPAVQDNVVRKAADDLMFGTFDQLESEATDSEAGEFKYLRNLIRALGGIFYEILTSDRSERRVFSIALSDDPPDEIMRVLRLGVRHGYFHEAAIGAKEGYWRTRRYVMTRRLAPQFRLDPTGFSGYLFVTTALLNEAIHNPKRAVTSFKEGRLAVLDEKQMALEF